VSSATGVPRPPAVARDEDARLPPPARAGGAAFSAAQPPRPELRGQQPTEPCVPGGGVA